MTHVIRFSWKCLCSTLLLHGIGLQTCFWWKFKWNIIENIYFNYNFCILCIWTKPLNIADVHTFTRTWREQQHPLCPLRSSAADLFRKFKMLGGACNYDDAAAIFRMNRKPFKFLHLVFTINYIFLKPQTRYTANKEDAHRDWGSTNCKKPQVILTKAHWKIGLQELGAWSCGCHAVRRRVGRLFCKADV